MGEKERKPISKAGKIGCALWLFIIISFLGFCALSGPDPIPEDPGATAKDDAAAFYEAIMGAGTKCDAYFATAGNALQGSDMVLAYRKATDAEAVCLGISSDIKAIEVPPSVGAKVHANLVEARDECAFVYTNKWSMMNQISDILDEGESVSALAGLQETSEAIQTGTLMCVGRITGELMDLGFTAEELETLAAD